MKAVLGLGRRMYKFIVIRDQCLTCVEILTILTSSLLLFFSRRNAAKRCMPIEWQQTARLEWACGSGRTQTTSLARPRYVYGSSAGRPSIPEFILPFSHSLYPLMVYPKRLEAKPRARVSLMSSVEAIRYLGKQGGGRIELISKGLSI